MTDLCYNKRLEDALKSLASSGFYPFHMPGHKRQGGLPQEMDITEIDGFDNLHAAEGILLGEMDRAALLYGAKSTRFLINGSTCGILAAISAAVPRGGRILIGRSSHISVYHAARLRGLHVDFMDGDRIPGEGFPARQPDAVVLTSPSYEGCVRDVGAWAEYAHRMGAALIVDEAHGAHFSMHPLFPESAVRLGADLVVQSVHKTLPGLTQTALLHNVSGRIPDGAVDAFLRIYETSSPSYILLASITSTIHEMMDSGGSCFDGYVERLKELRGRLASLECLRLAGGMRAKLASDGEIPGFAAGTKLDPGKLVILPGGSMGAEELYRRLREDYLLQPEMRTPAYVLLMTSLRDTEEGFRRLWRALSELDEEARTGVPLAGKGEIPWQDIPIPEAAMTMEAASEAPSCEIPLEDAPGRVSAGFLLLFPPDIPLVVPGEKISGPLIGRIHGLLDRGFHIDGIVRGKVSCVTGPSGH